MKILLSEKLVSTFRSRVNLGHATNNPAWEVVLAFVQGTWVEIETDHLFSWAFNTVPLPGVSPNGIRVEGWMVEVIDYEGDESLRIVQEALNGPGGACWCHHVEYNNRVVVDPVANKVPQEVTQALSN